jgi:CheY-like chemotaxis protein
VKPLALVIENDAATRRLLGVLLGRLGYEVDTVPSVADALLLLPHVEYHLHFLHLLPGTNTEEALRWLSTHRREALARCVVLSGASPAQLTRIVETWPEVRTIRKPFELTEVSEIGEGAKTGVTRRGDATEEFTRASVRAGARAGIILRAEGNELVPVITFGYSQGAIAAFLPITLDKPYPLCVAYTTQRPVFLASVNAASVEYPTLAPVFAKSESRAIAAVPLVDDEGAIGAAGWSFREPHAFLDAEREVFFAIARDAAHALRAAESTVGAV